MVTGLSDTIVFEFGVPAFFEFLFAMILFVATLCITVTAGAVYIVWRNVGGVAMKVSYSVFGLVCLLYVWLLYYWNLLTYFTQ